MSDRDTLLFLGLVTLDALLQAVALALVRQLSSLSDKAHEAAGALCEACRSAEGE